MEANLKFVNFMLVVFLLSLVDSTNAFFRHLCHGQLGIGRMDPLMSPGKASQHVHNIQGAQNFGLDLDIDHLMASNCTSCSVRQDKSVYWAPQMYFQHENGTFELVPTNGGMTVYYFTEPPVVDGKPVKLSVFPKGFRMIAGMSTKRKYFGPNPDPGTSLWTDYDRTQQALGEKSIGFNCLGSTTGPVEGTMQRHFMPDRAKIDSCQGGLRAEIQFPSCWNGVDLDSHNHTTHVAYPYLLRDGACPDGYPERFLTIMFETIYWVNTFTGQPGQYVFAHGDTTGYGYHGDFINGWEDGVIQQFLDQCVDPSGSGHQEDCAPLDIKPDFELTSCTMETPEVLQSEVVNMVEELPGGCRIEADVEWSNKCGKAAPAESATSPTPTEAPQYTAPANTSTQTSTGPSATSASEQPVDTSTSTSAIPSTTTAAEQPANSTSAVPPPETTPAPTTAPAVTDEVTSGLTTYTSSTIVNGTMLYYVIIEEVVTTTVVVDAAEPTPGATPAGAVKRHAHIHSKDMRKSTGHGHGHGSRKGARGVVRYQA